MRYWLLIAVLTAAYPGHGDRAEAAESATILSGRFPDGSAFLRTADVIYGRKHGTALTMDVYQPAEGGRGVGIVWAASGGWVSTHAIVGPEFHLSPTPTLVQRGYTVFAVVMGSQPKFTIPEMLNDLNRAVRFIRTHADDYGIDPAHIGITGGSAGAHLSLMQATAGDLGDSKAADPVDRASSRVQAVAGFFPPTDFLNYGEPGVVALGRGLLESFPAPFDFHRFDPDRGSFGEFVPVTDEQEILEIGREISPISHVSPDDPPVFIMHGDADAIVPIQQARTFFAKLEEQGVTVKLDVRKGAGHGWANLQHDWHLVADWFDEHLQVILPAPEVETLPTFSSREAKCLKRDRAEYSRMR